MLVIIYPTGTKRSIHLNHFVVEAEKADPDTIFITTQEFLEKPIDEWPLDTKFVVRVGAYSVQEILNALTKAWALGYCIFPNVPAIKNCLRKAQFYDLCLKNNINIPKFQVFADDGPDWHNIDFTEYGDCVIINQNSKHRIANNSNTPLVFIEVQTGSYFGEDDIVRIEDDYKRI